jgi:hypothetical protein
MSSTHLLLLKLVLLFFWSAWFGVVFLTNLFGGLKSAGMVGESWMFASKNYQAVAKAVSIYHAPSWLPALLFVGIVAWELAAAVLFGCAFAASLSAGALATGSVNAAFGAGLALWAAFMIADELTIKYAYEQSHELLFTAQLATLIAMYALPS